MARHSEIDHRSHRGPTAQPRPDRPLESSDEGIENQDESGSTLADRTDVHMGGDIGFDRIVSSDEAGLGSGLDQAEEAQLGVTDEELAEQARRNPK